MSSEPRNSCIDSWGGTPLLEAFDRKNTTRDDICEVPIRGCPLVMLRVTSAVFYVGFDKMDGGVSPIFSISGRIFR